MSHGSVLVVCTGNVCRSPYVERLLRRDLEDLGVEVASAGTGALVGEPMEPRVADRLRAEGGDPDGHAGRMLTADLVLDADLVITASRQHLQRVLTLAPRAVRRTWTLDDLARACAEPAPARDEGWFGARRTRVGLAALADDLSRVRGLVTEPDPELTRIPDPWGRGDAVVEEMAEHVAAALPAVSRRIARAVGSAHVCA